MTGVHTLHYGSSTTGRLHTNSAPWDLDIPPCPSLAVAVHCRIDFMGEILRVFLNAMQSALMQATPLLPDPSERYA
jgi:hypothetical protein